MPNMVNRLVTAEYTAAFEKSQGMILCSMGGLTVVDLEELRDELAKEGVRLRMVRNSLIRRVFAERGFELDPAMLAGNSGVAFGSIEGTIHCAKVMTSAKIKKAGKLNLRGAIFDGQLLSARDAAALADLPDKKTLRSKLVGCIQGPIRGLVTTLNGVPSGLARVLQAHADQAGAAAAATASPEAPAA
jgi:large subunit ribosomal protein L10